MVFHRRKIADIFGPQQRLMTKNVLSADNCSHLHLSFFGFERTICYVLNGHSIKSWPLNSKWVSALGHSCISQYKCSVSKAFQRTFGLSTGALFASNYSKTFFELPKKWPFNRQLRRFFEDKYLTLAVNFPTSAVKFCLFKRQICRWPGALFVFGNSSIVDPFKIFAKPKSVINTSSLRILKVIFV
jgi:hypothetical protein